MTIKDFKACNWDILGKVLRFSEIDDETGIKLPEEKIMSKIETGCYKVRVMSAGSKVSGVNAAPGLKVGDITMVSQITGSEVNVEGEDDYRSFHSAYCVAILKKRYPNTADITPLRDRVLLEPILKEAITEDGIKLPEDMYFGDSRLMEVGYGRILALGSEVDKEEFKLGDIVYYERDAFCEIETLDKGTLKLVFNDRIHYKRV